MAEFYLGEIQIFGFGFAPRGWALCNGQTMSIQQNAALFAVLGTTYGGDGIRTFMLPNLQSRLPMGQGNGSGLSPRVIGETVGEENHTLVLNEMPAHTHVVSAISKPTLSSDTDQPGPTVYLAQTTFAGSAGATTLLYVPDNNPASGMSPAAVATAGNNLPHSNLMPSLALNFCISLSGIFPSRS